ncbi:serine/threonine protein kinase, partial [Chloroflexota bacterium]
LEDGQRALFELNDWQVLDAPRSVLENKGDMVFCSIWLNMNVLVLDPKTICVEASETPVMELLDGHGFEVIPVPFYAVAAFGGGLHCSTADVYREGALEDYFPMQVTGF